jgi:DNA polymerase-3 subunit alpha
VLAVQTAYLKTHYPEEYMTAVLSVNQNDTSKVALYAADCRRIGIEVAPPDVNISEWDFSIEDHQDGKSTIRFGLGAVKNVGRAPVDVILEARTAEGPFENINDFAHQVDLRHVGKRALECLVRVGALDRFGPRPALLQSLDRLVSFSGAHFRAVEVGQMTLFGPDTGLQAEFSLPQLTGDISHREQLNWERELIGLYVSDHPLNPVMDVLTEIVTHFSGQLSEANPKDKVCVAGMITRYRTHQTRKGQSMAFATLEDILVDSMKTDLKITTARKETPAAQPSPPLPEYQTASEAVESEALTNLEIAVETQPGRVVSEGAADVITEGSPPYETTPPEELPNEEGEPDINLVEEHDEDLPPQPDIFSEDWELANAVMSAVVDPEAAIDLAEATAEEDSQPPAITSSSDAPLTGQAAETKVDTEEMGAELALPLPPFIISPLPATDSDAVHMITILLRSSNDKIRDNLRIRQIYGTLIAYPGKDRFAFHVFERGHGYQIEFPNFTTQLCPDLLNRLKAFVPADQLRVETITFQ